MIIDNDDELHNEIAGMFGELQERSIESGGWPTSVRHEANWNYEANREAEYRERYDRNQIAREQGRKPGRGGKRKGAGRKSAKKLPRFERAIMARFESVIPFEIYG